MPEPRLTALVLGSGAGGGFPQWNCSCRLCALVRAGDRARPRTQASVAVTADGSNYLLIGASPDLRQQIVGSAAPSACGRTRFARSSASCCSARTWTGSRACSCCAKGHAFTVFAPPPLLEVLRQSDLRRARPSPRAAARRSFLSAGGCGHGLALTLLPMPGEGAPLWGRAAARRGARAGADIRRPDRRRRGAA